VTTKTVDRRVRRTQELLRNALYSLIHDKGYDHVTVQDIIDRADVGRSTFYAHFRDKDDLLMSGFEEVRAAFELDGGHIGAAATDAEGQSLLPSLAFFEHADRSRSVYKALAGRRGAETVKNYIHRSLSDLVRAHLSSRLADQPTRVPSEAIVEFAVSALLGLALWWMEHDAPYSPQQMDEMYRKLTEPGVRYGLRAMS
jgi:AcrR family transcriptional regulator